MYFYCRDKLYQQIKNNNQQLRLVGDLKQREPLIEVQAYIKGNSKEVTNTGEIKNYLAIFEEKNPLSENDELYGMYIKIKDKIIRGKMRGVKVYKYIIKEVLYINKVKGITEKVDFNTH